MDSSPKPFPGGQRFLWAVGDDGEMQRRRLGKGEGEIMVSAVKMSRLLFVMCFSVLL